MLEAKEAALEKWSENICANINCVSQFEFVAENVTPSVQIYFDLQIITVIFILQKKKW
jgi:hypothetical protein